MLDLGNLPHKKLGLLAANKKWTDKRTFKSISTYENEKKQYACDLSCFHSVNFVRNNVRQAEIVLRLQ